MYTRFYLLAFLLIIFATISAQTPEPEVDSVKPPLIRTTGDVEYLHYIGAVKRTQEKIDSLDFFDRKKQKSFRISQIINSPEFEKRKMRHIISPDGAYAVLCPDIHGGDFNYLIFIDSLGRELNKFEFDRYYFVGGLTWNMQSSFLSLMDTNNGDFFCFSKDGSLIDRGNFNDLTRDSCTSYFSCVISKRGDFYILCNSVSYVVTTRSHFIEKLDMPVVWEKMLNTDLLTGWGMDKTCFYSINKKQLTEYTRPREMRGPFFKLPYVFFINENYVFTYEATY